MLIVVLAAALGALLPVGQASGQSPSSPPTVEDTMAQRMQACVVCHGKEGRAAGESYFPRIAGKPAGYLFNQLANFRDGRRNNAIMTYLVEHMTDDYLREIARYFAELDLPYAPPPAARVSAQTLERGRTLAFRGDPDRGVPACTACHGERLTGVQPAMPGLLGLPRDYLLGQFGAWRIGARKATPPDCMATIANRLSPEDVSAVASWLASQPVPVDASPAAAPPQLPLPLECGSGLR